MTTKAKSCPLGLKELIATAFATSGHNSISRVEFGYVTSVNGSRWTLVAAVEALVKQLNVSPSSRP